MKKLRFEVRGSNEEVRRNYFFILTSNLEPRTSPEATR